MIRQLIQRFQNEPVKLVLSGVHNNTFALYGMILEVHEDSILFKTNQTTSAIDMRVILEVTPLNWRSTR